MANIMCQTWPPYVNVWSSSSMVFLDYAILHLEKLKGYSVPCPRAILTYVPFRQRAMDWHQCDDIGDLPDDMYYHLFFSGQQAEVWFYVLWANFRSLMHFSGSLLHVSCLMRADWMAIRGGGGHD